MHYGLIVIHGQIVNIVDMKKVISGSNWTRIHSSHSRSNGNLRALESSLRKLKGRSLQIAEVSCSLLLSQCYSRVRPGPSGWNRMTKKKQKCP